MRSVYTGCIQPYSTQFQSIISVYKLHKSISELSFDVWSQQTEMLFQCVGYFALQGMYYTVYLTLPSHISRLFHLGICRIWDCTWAFLGACHTWHFSWKDLGVSPGPNEVYIVSFQGRCLSLSICIYLQIRIYIYIYRCISFGGERRWMNNYGKPYPATSEASCSTRTEKNLWLQYLRQLCVLKAVVVALRRALLLGT